MLIGLRNCMLSYSTVGVPQTFPQLVAAIRRFRGDMDAARESLVGIEIQDTWTATDGTVYDNPRVVWDVHYFEDENGVSHLGALMGTKYCLHSMKFDEAEGEECDSSTETVAETGIYYYGLAIGATSKTSTTLTKLTLSAGDALPYVDYAKIYKSSLSYQKTLELGYNNWRDSALRQYLNSDEEAGRWWSATHIGDVAPLAKLNAYRGFMAGCSDALLSAVKKVKVTTWPRAPISVQEETLDTFFLPSGAEIYGSVNLNSGAGVEGELSPYWQARTGYTEPNNKAAEPFKRSFYGARPVGSTASLSTHNVLLRSPSRSNPVPTNIYKVWHVYVSGELRTAAVSYLNYHFVPACVIY